MAEVGRPLEDGNGEMAFTSFNSDPGMSSLSMPKQLHGPSLLSADAAVDTVYGSRALRRMTLASQEEGYSTVVAKQVADLLWPVFKGKSGQLKDGHAKKVRLSV